MFKSPYYNKLLIQDRRFEACYKAILGELAEPYDGFVLCPRNILDDIAYDGQSLCV